MRHRYQKHYKTRRWKELRASVLRRTPFCQSPWCKDKRTPANVVDHITPHKGDTRLFYDISNLQALCTHCHNAGKKSQEMAGRGFDKGCDEAGYPTGGADGSPS